MRYLLALAALCLASCAAYSTAPVAAHAGAGYVVGSGPSAMMAAPSVSNRHTSEAQKAESFYR